MKTIILTITLSVATVTAFASLANAAEIVKKDNLPGNMRGGKQPASNTDGIPGCATGRAKLSKSEAMAIESVKAWADNHQSHDCIDASTLYVCKVGKNISVRCE